MTGSYRKTVEKLNEQAEELDRPPCRECRTATRRETLANYGGTCFPCFEAYCRQGLKGGVDGFEQGAPDTEQQAAMRKRLRQDRPTRGSQPRLELEPPSAITEDAKRETRLRAERYAREHGIELVSPQ